MIVKNKKGTATYKKVNCHPKMVVLSRKIPRKGRGEYFKVPQGVGVLSSPRRVTLDEPKSFNVDRRISRLGRFLAWLRKEH